MTVKKERIFHWWDYPIFAVLTCARLYVICSFIVFWLSLGDWKSFPIIFLILTCMLIIILMNNMGRWFWLLGMKRPKPMEPDPNWRVAVITTFVLKSEPLELLEKTVKSLIALDYPHATWVLDEENDDRVKKICSKYGAKHFSRKNFPHYQAQDGQFKSHSKHGNYNAWLQEVGFEQYDIITGFDPDHVPKENFLLKVLGYFKDPRIGYVQAAPAYYNQNASFIARGAAEETYSYFSSIQMTNYSLGFPIINGSHNTHRVAALKEIHGFAPHDADDLLATSLYRSHGWEGVYVPEILAKGLTPVDWNGYLVQQRRWARSVLDLKVRSYTNKNDDLSLLSRITNLLHGLGYLHKPIIILLAIILLIIMLITGKSPKIASFTIISQLVQLVAVLQISEFYRQRFYLDWRHEWGLHWRAALLHFAKWPQFILAFFDIFLGRKFGYIMTQKIGSDTKPHKLLWPHLLSLVLIGFAWAIGFRSAGIVNPLLHICAGILVVSSCILILTTFIKFPDPFDENLCKFCIDVDKDDQIGAGSDMH